LVVKVGETTVVEGDDWCVLTTLSVAKPPAALAGRENRGTKPRAATVAIETKRANTFRRMTSPGFLAVNIRHGTLTAA
jgi:hypothetical protein